LAIQTTWWETHEVLAEFILHRDLSATAIIQSNAVAVSSSFEDRFDKAVIAEFDRVPIQVGDNKLFPQAA